MKLSQFPIQTASLTARARSSEVRWQCRLGIKYLTGPVALVRKRGLWIQANTIRNVQLALLVTACWIVSFLLNNDRLAL
jgi:hypothetical protein